MWRTSWEIGWETSTWMIVWSHLLSVSSFFKSKIMTSLIAIKQWRIGKLKFNCNFLPIFCNLNLLWNTFSLNYMYLLFKLLWTFYVVYPNIFLPWAYPTLKSWVRHCSHRQPLNKISNYTSNSIKLNMCTI